MEIGRNLEEINSYFRGKELYINITIKEDINMYIVMNIASLIEVINNTGHSKKNMDSFV